MYNFLGNYTLTCANVPHMFIFMFWMNNGNSHAKVYTADPEV